PGRKQRSVLPCAPEESRQGGVACLRARSSWGRACAERPGAVRLAYTAGQLVSYARMAQVSETSGRDPAVVEAATSHPRRANLSPPREEPLRLPSPDPPPERRRCIECANPIFCGMNTRKGDSRYASAAGAGAQTLASFVLPDQRAGAAARRAGLGVRSQAGISSLCGKIPRAERLGRICLCAAGGAADSTADSGGPLRGPEIPDAAASLRSHRI